MVRIDSASNDEHGDTQAPDVAGAIVDPFLTTDPLHLAYDLGRSVEWCSDWLSTTVAIVFHGKSPVSQGSIEPAVVVVKSCRVDRGAVVHCARVLVSKRATEDARVVVINAIESIALAVDATQLDKVADARRPVFTSLEQDVLGLSWGKIREWMCIVSIAG